MNGLTKMEEAMVTSAEYDGHVALLNREPFITFAKSLEAKLLVAPSARGYYLTDAGENLRTQLLLKRVD